MARPLKIGIDYFPLNIDWVTDDKIFVLRAETGWQGIGIYMALISKIYEAGYYLEWNDKAEKIFAAKNNIDKDVLNKIVSVCRNEGLFDNKLFKKHGILTSVGIQKRFFEITRRREKVNVFKEYILININGYNNLIIVNINKDNADINPENDDDSTQSKVESKIESKEKIYFTENFNEKIDELMEAWNDYQDMRKKIKKPMTDNAAKKILNKLKELSGGKANEAIKILDQSTMNSWQGLFELKTEKSSDYKPSKNYMNHESDF